MKVGKPLFKFYPAPDTKGLPLAGKAGKWRFVTDGKYNIWLARWSPSQHAYITVDLLPIPNSCENIKFQSHVLAGKLTDIPAYIADCLPEEELT